MCGKDSIGFFCKLWPLSSAPRSFPSFPMPSFFPCLGSWLVSWRRNCFSPSLLRPPGERTESLSHFERKMSRDTGCMTKCWRRTVPFEIIWPFLGFLVLGLISILFAPNQAESCPSIASAVAGCEKWKLSARQFMGAPGLKHFPMQLYPESENRACRNLPVRFPNFSHSWLRGGRNYYCDKWHACLGKGRGTMLAVCSCHPLWLLCTPMHDDATKNSMSFI